MIHRTWRAPVHSATQLRRNRDINTPSARHVPSKGRCFTFLGHGVTTTLETKHCDQEVVLVIQEIASSVRAAEIPQKVVTSPKVIAGVMQRPRADLNRDRWTQSPEC